MKTYPEMSGQSSVVDAFYTQMSNGAVGAFYEADQAVEAVNVVPAEWASAMQVAETEIEQNQQQIAAKLTELLTATTRADSLEIYWEAEAIRMEAQGAEIVILEKQHQIDLLRKARAQAALPTVNGLPTADVLQNNRKTVQRIYLEITSNGANTLTPAQFDVISPIAHQCPLEGGSAVYMARALYQLNERKHFDDFSLCDIAVERNALEKPVTNPDELTLWPNPTSGKLQIFVPDVQTETAVVIQLTNLTGQVAMEKQIATSDGNLYLDLSRLTPGLYFCQVGKESQTFSPVRFIIAR
jgi:hypothetical protein